MRLKGVHIVALLTVLLLAASACGPRKIPRDDMESILSDMLLQDQQIKINREIKRQADTSLVYEGIFQAYGYNTDDFLHSLSYYLEDPVRMEKIMGSVADRLEKEAKEVGKELDYLAWQEKMLRIYGMKPDTSAPKPPVRPVDTLKIRFSDDSVWVEKPVDSLALVPKDSLLFVRDSL